MKDDRDRLNWSRYLSPLNICLLVVNGICFGGSLVLLATGKGSVLLTIGTGMMLLGGAAGALVAARKFKADGGST